MIKTILGNVNYSGMSFTDTTAVTPFNFRDREGSTCTLRSAGAGVLVGYQRVSMSVYGNVWFRQSSGGSMYASKDLVKNVNWSGKDLQLGIGGSVVGGPLIRVA